MTFDTVLNAFKAVGEESRLRIMALLRRGELTVSEITQILGQSQPRVSRHLKILADAGLVERHREGAWMFYRATLAGEERAPILAAVDALAGSGDRLMVRDRDRFNQSREARAAVAAAYFKDNAAEWDTVRGLHIEEAAIEERMRALVGDEPIGLFLDVGTGTGRMLTLFSNQYKEGVGFDLSREMLAVARANLDSAGIGHAQVRHGDLFALPIETASADVVCIHQVLHFLAEPSAAVAEAARLLRPGGRLIISDFAPHELEFLREAHAHRRLGFPDEEVAGWCAESGLELVEAQSLPSAAREGASLTVKIWLCAAPQSVRKLNTRLAAR